MSQYERNMEYLINHKVIYRQDPVDDKPTEVYEWGYFYEEGTGRRLYHRLEIRWGKIINIDHGTTKTVIERKGDPTFPMERTSEINEPIERGN